MKRLTLGLSLNIPIQQFAPIKVNAEVGVIRKESETEEEFFLRTHNTLTEALEAEVAIRTSEVLKIIKEGGLLLWATALANDLEVNPNKFVEIYRNQTKE